MGCQSIAHATGGVRPVEWEQAEAGGRRRAHRGADRQEVIRQVLRYVTEHPESFASLAVCRRALGSEPDGGQVDEATRARLEARLETVPDDELEAYYYIIS